MNTQSNVQVLFLNKDHLNDFQKKIPLEQITLSCFKPTLYPHIYHSEVVIVRDNEVSRIFKCPEKVTLTMATKDVDEYLKLLPPPVYRVLL